MSTTSSADDADAIGSLADLSGFQRDILWVLSHGDLYGLGIKRVLTDYRGKEINHGRLYPNLDTLAEEGFISKDALDDRTNIYSLTEMGAAALQGRKEWTETPHPDEMRL